MSFTGMTINQSDSGESSTCTKIRNVAVLHVKYKYKDRFLPISTRFGMLCKIKIEMSDLLIN